MINNLNNFTNKLKEKLINPQYNKKDYCMIYFWAVIIFTLIYKMITMPGFLFGGEVWAEYATNYYPATLHIAVKHIFSTDAGYWSFILRFIAFFGALFKLSPKIIPYYYSWSAVLIIPLFFAPFCLRDFRKVVQSDLFRFIICIAFVIITDFETSTFINFSYFSIFFITIISALALIEGREGKIPLYSYFIPLFIVTKPSVLAVIPIMVIISFFANRRYKIITLLSFGLSIAQGLRLLRSFNHGTLASLQNESMNFFDKIIFCIKKFIDTMPFFTLGDIYNSQNHTLTVILGLLIISIILFFSAKLYLKNKKAVSVLVPIGFLLAFLNILILYFSLPQIPRPSGNGIYITRHVIASITGVLFIVIGFLETLNKKYKNLGLIIFIIYFSLCWVKAGLSYAKQKDSPYLYNSKWIELSSKIDGKQDICIPINPYGWVYTQGKCSIVKTNFIYDNYEYVTYKNDVYPLDLDLSHKQITSFVLLVRSKDKKNKEIKASAKITYKDNKTVRTESKSKIHKTGGTIMFFVPETEVPPKNISFEFNEPVEILYTDNEPNILWFANRTEEE